MFWHLRHLELHRLGFASLTRPLWWDHGWETALIRVHPGESPPLWETTLMRVHPDGRLQWESTLMGLPWWETAMTRVHPDERSLWWESTLMKDQLHPDERPPWSQFTLMTDNLYESTLMKVHSDQRPPLWESTLMRPRMKDHPDDTSDERPPWWDLWRKTTLMKTYSRYGGHPSKKPPWWRTTCWETTLMKDHPDEGPPWWEPTREAGATLNGHDAVQHSDVRFPQRYAGQAVQLLQERLRHELQLRLPLLQSRLAVLVPAPTFLHLHRLCTHTHTVHTQSYERWYWCPPGQVSRKTMWGLLHLHWLYTQHTQYTHYHVSTGISVHLVRWAERWGSSSPELALHTQYIISCRYYCTPGQVSRKMRSLFFTWTGSTHTVHNLMQVLLYTWSGEQKDEVPLLHLNWLYTHST